MIQVWLGAIGLRAWELNYTSIMWRLRIFPPVYEIFWWTDWVLQWPTSEYSYSSRCKVIFFTARTVPFSLREKVEKKSDRQEASNSTEKIQFSRWTTAIVPVLKKNLDIWLCGNYSVIVYKVLQKVSYPPSANEIFSKLSGCNIFSKLDLPYAYLKLRVGWIIDWRFNFKYF